MIGWPNPPPRRLRVPRLRSLVLYREATGQVLRGLADRLGDWADENRAGWIELGAYDPPRLRWCATRLARAALLLSEALDAVSNGRCDIRADLIDDFLDVYAALGDELAEIIRKTIGAAEPAAPSTPPAGRPVGGGVDLDRLVRATFAQVLAKLPPESETAPPASRRGSDRP